VRGVLNWLASRPAFVSEPGHRIRLVSLPKHRSGQNHIAVVVGVFLQQVSRGGLFTLVAGLRFKLFKDLDDFRRGCRAVPPDVNRQAVDLHRSRVKSGKRTERVTVVVS
jgi:hypothetical protein